MYIDFNVWPFIATYKIKILYLAASYKKKEKNSW